MSVSCKKRGKRGQVTIFIIIAILIIALAFLVYEFFPGVKSGISGSAQSPQAFIQQCLQTDFQNVIQNLSLQGGSYNPQLYILYQNSHVTYLCYTNENYKLCTVQQPLLKEHIQSEIQNQTQDDVINCFNSLQKTYQSQGYTVSMTPGATSIGVLPKRVVGTFNYTVTLTKSQTERYNSFSVVLDNNIYELIGVAENIVSWETTQGDADAATYMAYYPDLKVEKNVQVDGSKIYILTDRNTGFKFQFAVRSLVTPPGVGT